MKRNVLLLIAGILGIAYALYLISHFGGSISSASGNAELVGAGIATLLVGPHMFFVVVAVVFNIIAWIGNTRWAALVAGILYSVSILVFILYGLFVLVQAILCFVAFANMKKQD